MQMKLSIRRQAPGDESAVFNVVHQAFDKPDEAEAVDKIVARQGEDLALVAVLKGRIVGHILFSPMSVENYHGEAKITGLAPLAVHPDFQNQGIGKRLVEEGLQQVRELGFTAVVVLGSETYYGNLGFSPGREWNLDFCEGAFGDHFRVIVFDQAAMKDCHGQMHYVPEIETL
jgi:putative acetyltransferase